MSAGTGATEPDVEGLVAAACAGKEGGLADLARLRPDLIRPFHRRLIDGDVWWPQDLYRVMDEATAGYLVQRIEAGADRPDKLLELLAAGATQTAARVMARWDREPPDWAAGLYWPVSRYAHMGGWELTAGGLARPLASQSALTLVAAGPGEVTVSGGALPARCQWCGLSLWRILDVDLAEWPLPGIGDAGRITAGTCIRCGCYATIYTEYDAAGSCWWADGNRRPGFLPDDDGPWDLPATPGLRAGDPRPTSFSGSAWSAGGSTLGGLPDWIGDPEYPQCPRCDATMAYLAMITGTDLHGDSAEGCHYVFCDRSCRLAAAVYQQS